MAITLDLNESGSKQHQVFVLSDLTDLNKIKSICNTVGHEWSKRVTLDTIRPLPLFLGISGPSFCFSPEAFNPPSKKLDKNTFEKITGRLSLNFSFFLSNYVLTFVGTVIVVSLMNTEMIMYVALISTLWWFHLFTIKNNIPISLGGKNLDDFVSVNTRSNVLLFSTFLVILFYCLIPVISMISISGFLIICHALLRDPKHIENSAIFRRGTEVSSDSDGEICDSEDSGEVIVNKRDIV